MVIREGWQGRRHPDKASLQACRHWLTIAPKGRQGKSDMGKTKEAQVSRSLFSLAILCLTTACIRQYPTDLAIRSVEAVDWRDQKEMPGPGASPLRGILSEAQLAQAGESILGGEKPPRLLIKTEIESAQDLLKFIRQNDYALYANGYLCNDKSEDVLASSTVYSRGSRLSPHLNAPAYPHGIQPYIYYIYLDVIRSPGPKNLPPRPGHDFLRQAEDVCIYLSNGGGPLIMSGFTSNTIVLPKSAIEGALKKLPAGFQKN